jgi:hypothetical protein
MRFLAVILLACGSSTPQTQVPVIRDAGNPSDPPTTEQCEQVLGHLADLSVFGEPDDTPDTVESKKKLFIDTSKKQGFIALCRQGSRAVADCKIKAADLDSQTQCTP